MLDYLEILFFSRLFASHKRLRTLDTWISERSWNKAGLEVLSHLLPHVSVPSVGDASGDAGGDGVGDGIGNDAGDGGCDAVDVGDVGGGGVLLSVDHCAAAASSSVST